MFRLLFIASMLLSLMAISRGQELTVTAIASPDTLCYGNTVQLEAVASGGTGLYSYSWTSDPAGFVSDEANPTDNPYVTIVYYLTVSDGDTIVSDTVTVTVNPLPVPEAGSNSPVCTGRELRLTGGPSDMESYSWTGPGGFFSQEQNPLVSLSVTADMAGDYILRVTDSNGCTDTAVIPVVINITPSITETISGSRCGSGVVELSATASAGTIGWYSSMEGGELLGTGETFTTPGISATTSYWVESVFDACTTAVRTEVTATINPVPSVPEELVDCSLGFNHAVVSVTSPLGPGYEYSINGGSYQESNVFTDVVNGNYEISVINEFGCITSGSSFEVSCGCVDGPIVNLSSDIGSTCGTSTVTVNDNIFGGSASLVTLSSDGSGVLSPLISDVSPFSFSYTPSEDDIGKDVIITVITDNPLGEPCVASEAQYVLTVKVVPVIESTTSGSRCGPGVVELSATASAGTIGWYSSMEGGELLGTGETFTTPGISATTSYWVESVFDGCTTAVRTEVTATINPVPSVPEELVDCSLGFNHAVVTVTSPLGPGYEYSINGGSYQESNVFTDVVNDNYEISVINEFGCITSGSLFEVSCGCVDGPVVNLSSDSGSTCGTSTVTVSDNIFGGSASLVTLSSDGSGVLSPLISDVSPFSFSYTPSEDDIGKDVIITVVTDNPLGEPCVASEAQYVLTVKVVPVIESTTSGSRCGPGVVELSATANAGTIGWYSSMEGGELLGTGETFTTPGISATTSYWVESVFDACTTAVRTEVTATINPIPAVVVTDPEPVCSPAAVDITATTITVGSTSGLTFTYWTDPEGTVPYPTPEAATAGIYYIKGTSSAGCYDIKPVVVTVINLPSPAGPITGPSVFIPGTSGVAYSVNPVPGADTYIWTYTGSGVNINGTGTEVTLDFSMSATAGQLRVRGSNICGYGEEAFLAISEEFKSLNLTVYLEGFFDGVGQMRKVRSSLDGESSFDMFPGTIADTLTIQIAEVNAPYDLVYSEHGVPVHTDGSVNLGAIPSNLSDNYYIIVKHRNHIETWSRITSFSTSEINYNFTDAVDKAWGNNMVNIGGRYCLYTGDTTSDGYVDGFDLVLTFTLNKQGSYGYQPSDVNGDGFIDGFDLVNVFINNKKGVGKNTPESPL